MAAVDFLSDALASLLALFYQVVPSYAGAIVLLTLLVMIVLTPLTLKGTRSMMLMQQLQPEMRKIQNKYKDDRQKLNEELLAFYKEKNINPMGGCLPLFAQMPVFFILYSVLRGLTRRESSTGLDIGWVTGGDLTGAVSQPPDLLLNFDPAYIHQDTSLYESLSRKNQMEGVFGLLDLSESASQALSSSLVDALPYLLLIAVVAVSGYVQQKQIQGRMSKDQINPQQQMLMRITPIMLPVFSFGLPSGLVLYFVVSNLYRIGQQWFITRSIYGLKRGERPESKVVVDTTGEEVEEGRSKAYTEKKGVATPSAKGKGAPQEKGGLLSRSLGKGAAPAGKAAPAKGGGKAGGKGAKAGGAKAGGAKRAGSKRTTPPKAKPSSTQPAVQPRARKSKKR